MTALLLVAALLAFVAIGGGASLLRSTPRPALTGGYPQRACAWFATLHGRRALGAALVAGGALVFVLVLMLRP